MATLIALSSSDLCKTSAIKSQSVASPQFQIAQMTKLRESFSKLFNSDKRGASPSPTGKGDEASKGPSTAEAITLEQTYSAHNYHPIPVVFSKAEGAKIWDPEGRVYLDFLSAYSAVNQGHCHPRLLATLSEQAAKLTLCSRAFYNDQFGLFAKFITEYFKYDMVLPMNTGAEGVETALKLARKWGYLKKGIPENEAIILSCEGNFHGRTIGIISMSSDADAKRDFGPYLPNVGYACPASAAPGDRIIRHGSVADLQAALEQHGPRVAAFLVEPIQGEAGIHVPPEGYLRAVADLCRTHNVLLIADEVQTGLARTGRLLAVDHEDVRPDMVILGKALSGGMYPVSCVLADKDIMLCIKPGEHGSTYGGNPLGSALAITALQIIKDENLCEKADALGKIFRAEIESVHSPLVKEVRGKGLLNAVVLDPAALTACGKSAWHFCLLLKHRGLLAKPTHDYIIRFAPPLVIPEADLRAGIETIKACLADFEAMPLADIPDHDK